MREPRETDFFIELPDVGTFRYGRRTLGDRLQIRANYLRLTMELGDADPDLSLYAGVIASHSVLCVEAPKGWEDLSAVDLTGPGDPFTQILELFGLLKDREDAFAKGVTKSGEGDGEGGV